MSNQVGGGEEEGGVEAAEAEVWEVPGVRWKNEVLPEGWMPKEQQGWMPREQQGWMEDHSLPEGWISSSPMVRSTAPTIKSLESVMCVEEW